MTRTGYFAACMLLLCALACPPATAQDEPTGPTTREQVDTQLEALRQQLALSEYTWNQVHLILKTSIRERIAIANKYGLDAAEDRVELSSKEQRRMRKELKSSRKSTAERMERYLDKEQMKAFEKLQEAIDTEFLARVE